MYTYLEITFLLHFKMSFILFILFFHNVKVKTKSLGPNT